MGEENLKEPKNSEKSILDEHDPDRSLITGYNLLESKPNDNTVILNLTPRQVYQIEDALVQMQPLWEMTHQMHNQIQDIDSDLTLLSILNVFQYGVTKRQGLDSYITLVSATHSPAEVIKNLSETAHPTGRTSEANEPIVQFSIACEEFYDLHNYMAMHLEASIAYAPSFWRNEICSGPQALVTWGLMGVFEMMENPHKYDTIEKIVDPPLQVKTTGDPLHDIREYLEILLKNDAHVDLAYVLPNTDFEKKLNSLPQSTRDKLRGGHVFSKFNKIPFQIEIGASIHRDYDPQSIRFNQATNTEQAHRLGYALLDYLDAQFNRVSPRPPPAETMVLGHLPINGDDHIEAIVRTMNLFQRSERPYTPFGDMKIIPTRHFAKKTVTGLYFEGLTLADITALDFPPSKVYHIELCSSSESFINAKASSLLQKNAHEYKSRFPDGDLTPQRELYQALGEKTLDLAKQKTEKQHTF